MKCVAQQQKDLSMSENKIYDESFGKRNPKKFFRNRDTRYKDAEEFPQWKSPEEVFDIQRVMQEIMERRH